MRYDSYICADPESIVNGGPTLSFFSLAFGGREDLNTVRSGLSGPISALVVKRHLNGISGGPIVPNIIH